MSAVLLLLAFAVLVGWLARNHPEWLVVCFVIFVVLALSQWAGC